MVIQYYSRYNILFPFFIITRPSSDYKLIVTDDDMKKHDESLNEVKNVIDSGELERY